MKLMKKDYILIILILCAAAMAFLIHGLSGKKGAGSVTIKVSGEITGVYSLAEDQEIEINKGSNILQIKDGQADMTDAECPDKLCVHQKAISKNHESIICLPNKVVVEVESDEVSDLDEVAN